MLPNSCEHCQLLKKDMPKVLYPIEDTKESITRPVVFDVARRVQEWTGMPNIPILFPGETEMAAQPGSTINNEVKFNKFESESLWRITIDEETDKDRILATAVHQTDHGEFFLDEKLNIFMRPIYSQTNLTLNFELRTTDKNTAERWRQDIRARVSTNLDVREHIIHYHYLVPIEYEEFLSHVHDLREAQAGYGEDYETWIKNCFTRNMTVLTNQGATTARWAVREQQARVMGLFDFEGEPEKGSKEGETTQWVLTFAYKVMFEKPVAVSADFPLLIHNQLIDERFVPANPVDTARQYAARSSRSATAMGAFEVDVLARPTVLSGIRLPEYHEFYPATVFRKTLQVVSALLMIDPDPANPGTTGMHEVLDLRLMDEEFQFRDEFLDFLVHEHMWLNKYGESLVNVCVYKGDMPLHHSCFKVTPDLKVVMTDPPDLRNIYYVRISLVTDPTVLSERARESARDHVDGLLLIGAAVCPNLVKAGLLPKVLAGKYIPRAEAEKFYRRIAQCTGSHQAGLHSDMAVVQWNTVMILFIEAVNKQDLKK